MIWKTTKPAARPKPTGQPAAGDGDETAGRRRNRQRERKENDEVWPNLSVTVGHGHVFLASHRDFLEQVLATARTSLIAEDDGYRDVAAELNKLLGGERALSSFNRTEKLVRPAHELLRAGRLPESKSLAGSLLKRMFEGDGQDGGKLRDLGQPKQRVDGSSLPEFEEIRSSFGVNGMSMQSTPGGWYLMGVGHWNGLGDGGKRPAAP